MNSGKLFGIWTLFVALLISATAAYYSIIGLTAIFAAAVIPIIIMGSALEVAKVTTAVWLHAYWHTTPKLMRFYLTLATVILMFITSMGIFGFLSRAHIEQTSVATESVAKIEVIQEETQRYEDLILRAETQIIDIQSRADDQDTGLQDKIDAEQQRIDSAYTRIQPAIDEQNTIITTEQAKGNNTQELDIQGNLDRVNAKIEELERLQRANDARALQSLVGAKVDGRIGPQTRAAIASYESDLRAEKSSLQTRLDRVLATAQQPDADIIASARDEIARLRSNAESEIANSLTLIERLRERVSVDTTSDIQSAVDAEYAKIDAARDEMDTLRTERFELEKENRKLEAEVGPVKYLADLIYGDQADTNTLEAAVRWVILLLVVVFDPLAVILVIAGVMTIERSRKKTPAIIKKQVDIVPEVVHNNIIKEKPQQEEEPVVEVKSELDLDAYTKQEEITPVDEVEEDPALQEMLNQADPETLDEVYKALASEEEVVKPKVKPLLPTSNGKLSRVSVTDPATKTIKNITLKTKKNND